MSGIRNISVYRLKELPTTLEPDAMYFIKADGETTARQYLTNNDGEIKPTPVVTPGNVVDFEVSGILKATTLQMGSGTSTNFDGIVYSEATNTFTFKADTAKDGNTVGTSTVVASRIRLKSGADAGPSSINHAFQIGEDSSSNLIIDGNEIMARSNGVAVPIYSAAGFTITAVPTLGSHVGNRLYNDQRYQMAGEARSVDVFRAVWSADWQPKTAAHIALFQQLLTGIATYHPKTDLVFANGDLIHRASDEVTGLAPAYGFQHLKVDFSIYCSPISLSKLITLPGNHDAHSAVQSDPKNLSLHGYRQAFGDEYYAFIVGNLMFIGLGDMAAGTGGEVLKPVLDWFEEIVKAYPKNLIFLNTHQPLRGTHDLLTAPKWFQNEYTSTRITDVLDQVSNVVGVFYGHVGGNNYDNCTRVQTLHGTKHINCQVGLPNISTTGKLFYRFLDIDRGATSATLQVMNVTDGVVDTSKDLILDFPFPADVGDGIRRDARILPPKQSAQTIFATMDTFRDTTAPFEVTPDIRWMSKIGTMDTAADNAQSGEGVGTVYYVPGSFVKNDPDGTILLSREGWGAGGGVASVRTNDSDENFTTETWLYAATQGAGLDSLVPAIGGCADQSFKSINGYQAHYHSGWVYVDKDTATTGKDFPHNLDLDDPFILDVKIYFNDGLGGRTFDWGNSSPVSAAAGTERFDGSISFKDKDTLTLGVGNQGVFAVDNINGPTNQIYTGGLFYIIAYKVPNIPPPPSLSAA